MRAHGLSIGNRAKVLTLVRGLSVVRRGGTVRAGGYTMRLVQKQESLGMEWIAVV